MNVSLKTPARKGLLSAVCAATIQDTYTQEVYHESEELKEAEFCKSADSEFTSGSECELVVLKIRRLPAGRPIRGKLWLGEFHLSRKASESSPH